MRGPLQDCTTESGHPQSTTGCHAEQEPAIRLHQVVSRLRDSVRVALTSPCSNSGPTVACPGPTCPAGPRCPFSQAVRVVPAPPEPRDQSGLWCGCSRPGHAAGPSGLDTETRQPWDQSPTVVPVRPADPNRADGPSAYERRCQGTAADRRRLCPHLSALGPDLPATVLASLLGHGLRRQPRAQASASAEPEPTRDRDHIVTSGAAQREWDRG